VPAVLLVALTVALAQASVATEVAVEEVTRALEQHYNRVRTLEADFVQRYTLGAQTLVESGRVYFQKPGRMRWDYTNPTDKLFLTDGEYAYLYVHGEQQVRRQPLKQAGEWQAAFALLLGRVELNRIFSGFQLVRVHRLGGPTRWQLRALAKSDKQAFTEIWFDLDDRYRIQRVEIRQRDGSLMEFHFRAWQENHTLSPDLFRLRLPPGTGWVDDAPS
jgi:outer membrane lipoprotein carrier protein